MDRRIGSAPRHRVEVALQTGRVYFLEGTAEGIRSRGHRTDEPDLPVGRHHLLGAERPGEVHRLNSQGRSRPADRAGLGTGTGRADPRKPNSDAIRLLWRQRHIDVGPTSQKKSVRTT